MKAAWQINVAVRQKRRSQGEKMEGVNEKIKCRVAKNNVGSQKSDASETASAS
ncbi:MAG: hypothetical protein JWL59_1608 [Chthoniobacteraceae bacterium]|nr:hypothetical protein [Chthoniobacteraceae bacterium]